MDASRGGASTFVSTSAGRGNSHAAITLTHTAQRTRTIASMGTLYHSAAFETIHTAVDAFEPPLLQRRQLAEAFTMRTGSIDTKADIVATVAGDRRPMTPPPRAATVIEAAIDWCPGSRCQA